MITKTDAHNRTLLDSGVDAVYNNGKIQLFDTAPAGASAVPAGTKIAEGACPADLFAAATSPSAGVTTKDLNAAVAIAGLAAAGAGTTARAFRIVGSGDTAAATQNEPRIEGTVGVAGAAVNITGAALAGGMLELTAAGHGLADGDDVEIAGHSVAGVNGRWVVFASTVNTFRIAYTSAGGAGGTAKKTYDLALDNASIANGQAGSISSLAIYA